MDRSNSRLDNAHQAGRTDAASQALLNDTNLPMPSRPTASNGTDNSAPLKSEGSVKSQELLSKIFSGTADGERLFSKIDTSNNWLSFTSGDREITREEVEKTSSLSTFRGANRTTDVDAAKLLRANWNQPEFQIFKNSDGNITKQSFERGVKTLKEAEEGATDPRKGLETAQLRRHEMTALNTTLAPAARVLNGSEAGHAVFKEMEGYANGSGLSKVLVKHIAESNPNNPLSYSAAARATAQAMYKAWDHPDFQAYKTGNGIITSGSFFRGAAENRAESDRINLNLNTYTAAVTQQQMRELAKKVEPAQPPAKTEVKPEPLPKPEPKPESRPTPRPESKPTPTAGDTGPEAGKPAPKALEQNPEKPKTAPPTPEQPNAKLSADLGRAALVRRGEGPYQVAARILGLDGAKPDHKSIMELTRAFQAQYKEEQGKHARWSELKVNHKFLTNENLAKVLEKMPNTSAKNKLEKLMNRNK